MLKTVTYPKFVFNGIRANHRAYPVASSLRVSGGDTETENGQPLALILCDGGEVFFKYVTAATIFVTFRDWIFPRCRARGVNIIYFHNLNFDLTVLFAEKRLILYEQGGEFKFTYKGCEVSGIYGKVNCCEITYGDKTLKIFDSFAFTSTSLDKSFKMFHIEASKLKKPKRLGLIRYDELSPDDPERLEFETYSRGDGGGQYKLAERIIAYHQEYGVRPSISLPQFAARVLRHHFFKRDEVIEFPPAAVVTASELSYHGGKNGYYYDEPRVVEDAYEIDISSAYPYAMLKLPQMIQGRYAHTSKYRKGYMGVYRISGHDHGRYPLVFDHGFKPVRDFKDLWITGHELAHVLKSRDCKVSVEEGWVWLHDESYKHNPLVDYVRHFYTKKEKAGKKDPNYNFYKLCMNGLYGKFLQTTEISERDSLDADAVNDPGEVPMDYKWDEVTQDYVRVQKENRAGGLYNPFLATQITGFVRAYLYELEIKHGSFHSATDAIKTTKFVPAVKGLGGLKVETFGRCYMFRNKLYLHYARSNKYCGHNLKPDPKAESQPYWIRHKERDGQHLCKYGLHGFKGKLDLLVEARHKLIAGESLSYEYDHMVKLREGLRRRQTVAAMTKRQEVLKLRSLSK